MKVTPRPASTARSRPTPAGRARRRCRGRAGARRAARSSRSIRARTPDPSCCTTMRQRRELVERHVVAAGERRGRRAPRSTISSAGRARTRGCGAAARRRRRRARARAVEHAVDHVLRASMRSATVTSGCTRRKPPSSRGRRRAPGPVEAPTDELAADACRPRRAASSDELLLERQHALGARSARRGRPRWARPGGRSGRAGVAPSRFSSERTASETAGCVTPSVSAAMRERRRARRPRRRRRAGACPPGVRAWSRRGRRRRAHRRDRACERAHRTQHLLGSRLAGQQQLLERVEPARRASCASIVGRVGAAHLGVARRLDVSPVLEQLLVELLARADADDLDRDVATRAPCPESRIMSRARSMISHRLAHVEHEDLAALRRRRRPAPPAARPRGSS